MVLTIWGKNAKWFSCAIQNQSRQSIAHTLLYCCSVTKSCLTVTSWPAAHQAPLSSTTSWVCSNLCPLSHWYYLTISSSAIPFSFCLHSFPPSGSFPVNRLFASGGKSIGVWASASVLPVNIQGLFPLGLTGLIPLQSKGPSRVFSSTSIWKHHFFGLQASLWSNSHVHTWLLEKPNLWLDRPLSAKWCLCFLIHYVCIAFLPRSKHLLISWLQSPSTVILEPKAGEGGNLSLLPFFPFAFAMKCWDQIHTLVIQSLLDILSLNLG